MKILTRKPIYVKVGLFRKVLVGYAIIKVIEESAIVTAYSIKCVIVDAYKEE